jgi:hypothetical protein
VGSGTRPVQTQLLLLYEGGGGGQGKRAAGVQVGNTFIAGKWYC